MSQAYIQCNQIQNQQKLQHFTGTDLIIKPPNKSLPNKSLDHENENLSVYEKKSNTKK